MIPVTEVGSDQGVGWSNGQPGWHDGLRVIGWLVPSALDQLRLVIGDVCADFSVKEVRAITPLGSRWPMASEVPLQVEVEFSRPPSLLWLGPSLDASKTHAA